MREEYEGESTGLHRPFGRTGQGVYLGGEAKGVKPRSRSESDKPAAALSSEGRGVKAPEVTGIRPEAGRSIPGQGEVPRKRDGGPIPVVRCQSLG